MVKKINNIKDKKGNLYFTVVDDGSIKPNVNKGEQKND
jgi:hypothetical protein